MKNLIRKNLFLQLIYQDNFIQVKTEKIKKKSNKYNFIYIKNVQHLFIDNLKGNKCTLNDINSNTVYDFINKNLN